MIYFIINAALFCIVLTLNLVVGFTPFTLGCVIFIGLMALATLIGAIKE